MSAVIDHMRKVPLFRGMSTSALETVADRATETTFEDGETVTREGEARCWSTYQVRTSALRRLGIAPPADATPR